MWKVLREGYYIAAFFESPIMQKRRSKDIFTTSITYKNSKTYFKPYLRLLARSYTLLYVKRSAGLEYHFFTYYLFYQYTLFSRLSILFLLWLILIYLNLCWAFRLDVDVIRKMFDNTQNIISCQLSYYSWWDEFDNKESFVLENFEIQYY